MKRIICFIAAICLLMSSAMADCIFFQLDSGTMQFDESTGIVSECYKLVNAAPIPEKVNGITVTGIDDFAFQHCDSMVNAILPETITSIGAYAFDNCYSLISVNIPSGVKTIGEFTFAYCSSMPEIEISENVKTIGFSAFIGCENLKKVTLPQNLESIGNSAFSGCYALTDVYFGGTEQQWESIKIGKDNELLTNAKIHFTEIDKPTEEPKPDDKPVEPDKPTEEPKPEKPVIVKGDVNGDGAVSNADIVLIAQYVVQLTEFNDTQHTAADFNGDGEITNADLVDVAQIVVM